MGVESDIFALLKKLEEELLSASTFGLSKNFVKVDKAKMLGIIEKIREYLPDEWIRAKAILTEQYAMIDQAQKELDSAREKAKYIIADAEDRAQFMLQEHNIMLGAKKEASALLYQNEEYMSEVKSIGMKYIDDKLAMVEDCLSDVLKQVRLNREELNGGPIKGKGN